MPASALACLLAFPSRYVATFVWLSAAYFPTWVSATQLGAYVRWQLGWGLTDLQTVGPAHWWGFAGVVAWSRGTIRGSLVGFKRLLIAHGGHLVVVMAMAASPPRSCGVRVCHSPAVALADLGLGRSRFLRSLRHAARRTLGFWRPSSHWPSARFPTAEVHRSTGHSSSESDRPASRTTAATRLSSRRPRRPDASLFNQAHPESDRPASLPQASP